MTDKTDLIREIHEYVTTHGGENTATHLLVQAASVIQTQAAELEAVGAGGVQALSAAPAEVLGWIYEDELPEHYPYDAMFPHSKVDTVRMFPVFGPQAASPTPPAEQQAEESLTKLLAECRCAFPVPEPGSPLEVQWAAAMARPEEVPEYVRLCVASMQAAPKAAPGASELAAIEKEIAETCMNTPPGWRCTRKAGHDGSCAAVPCPEDLEFVASGMERIRKAEAAPQQDAQKPIALLVRKNSWRAGQWEAAPPDSPHYGLTWANQRKYVYEAPQPAPAPLSDDVVRDAARWRWLSEHIGVAWNEGKFTSLVRIVSDKNRAALNASIDRMMTGDWSDAALAAQERQP